jgi:hypothetical protein
VTQQLPGFWPYSKFLCDHIFKKCAAKVIQLNNTDNPPLFFGKYSFEALRKCQAADLNQHPKCLMNPELLSRRLMLNRQRRGEHPGFRNEVLFVFTALHLPSADCHSVDWNRNGNNCNNRCITSISANSYFDALTENFD